MKRALKKILVVMIIFSLFSLNVNAQITRVSEGPQPVPNFLTAIFKPIGDFLNALFQQIGGPRPVPAPEEFPTPITGFTRPILTPQLSPPFAETAGGLLSRNTIEKVKMSGLIEQPEFLASVGLPLGEGVIIKSPVEICRAKSNQLIGLMPIKICENTTASYKLEGTSLKVDYICKCVYAFQ